METTRNGRKLRAGTGPRRGLLAPARKAPAAIREGAHALSPASSARAGGGDNDRICRLFRALRRRRYAALLAPARVARCGTPSSGASSSGASPGTASTRAAERGTSVVG